MYSNFLQQIDIPSCKFNKGDKWPQAIPSDENGITHFDLDNDLSLTCGLQVNTCF